MKLIEQDLNKMASKEPSGYFGHRKRNPKSDSELLKALNMLGMDFEQALNWLKSEKAKKFVDSGRLFMKEFAKQISKDINVMAATVLLKQHKIKVSAGKVRKKDLIKALQIINIHGSHLR